MQNNIFSATTATCKTNNPSFDANITGLDVVGV